MKTGNETTSGTNIGSIDWDAIHKRLKQSQKFIEQGSASSIAEQKKLLKARARILSEEPPEEQAGETIQVVEFLLAHEHYGIETALVSEVYQIRDLTKLPGTPEFVAGIINVRGRVVSVVDIKKLFNLPQKGLTDLNKAIIIGKDGMEFAILADNVLDLCSVPLQGLQSSLPTLSGVRQDYLLGITKNRLIVLDGERLVQDSKLIVDS